MEVIQKSKSYPFVDFNSVYDVYSEVQRNHLQKKVIVDGYLNKRHFELSFISSEKEKEDKGLKAILNRS